MRNASLSYFDQHLRILLSSDEMGSTSGLIRTSKWIVDWQRSQLPSSDVKTEAGML
jgi:hypothetical protein